MPIREISEQTVLLIEKYTDYKIDPIWIDGLVGLSMLFILGLTLKSVYLWMRRRLFNDLRALPEDQLAMVNIIALDVNSIKRDLHDVQESLRANIAMQMDKVVEHIKINFNDNEVNSTSPAPPPAPAITATGTKLRKLVALRVRDSVMEKFVEGGWFKEDEKVRHVYQFKKNSTNRMLIEMELETPYRDEKQRPCYVLQIWVDDKKKMNLEWSVGNDANLRYLNAGDWVEALTNWKFLGPRKAKTPLSEAAE